ncbi:MAG TPA: acetylglutamate kinase [Vicinamibacteria bacterium]|nr:acetylglutamate kinase [Vicinamibacteria bacterium]
MNAPVRVYKLGGPALEDPGLLGPLAAELRAASARVAVVHGGGRHVERMLRALGIESRFVDGRRETSPAAMEVVEMILSGVVNKALAAGLTEAGLPAVGISGRDGGLVRARLVPELGRVGTPETVDPRPVQALWDAGLVPVISPVASGPGGVSVNVNADEAAYGLARALGARSLVYLSDVPGVRVGERTVASLDAAEAARLIADGTIAAGMALKVQVALAAASGGIEEVIVAGKERLLEGFPGTRIVAPRAPAAAEPGAEGARA